MKRYSLLIMAGACLATSAHAQNTYMWPAPQTGADAHSMAYFLPMGTPLMLRTRTQVSTKDNKPGDRVYLEVAQSVSFRGQVVIPVGAPVLAEVASAQRNGHFGKKGKIMVRLIQVETPSGPVRLSGSAYDEGKSGTALSVGTFVFASMLGGFLIHGTSGAILPDTPVQAYLAEPLHFAWYPSDARQATAAVPVPADSYAPAVKPGFDLRPSSGAGKSG